MLEMAEVGLFFGGFAVGWALGGIVECVRSAREASDRNDLVDKLLSGGDPARLYNLKVADRVGKDPRVVDSAVDTEISRSVPEDEGAVAPWETHPEFKGCDVTFNGDMVYIRDDDATDGPDVYEMPAVVFWAKLGVAEDPTVDRHP